MTSPEGVLAEFYAASPCDPTTCAACALDVHRSMAREIARLESAREVAELIDWLHTQDGGNLFTPFGADPRMSGWRWYGPGGKTGEIAVRGDTILDVLRAVKAKSAET